MCPADAVKQPMQPIYLDPEGTPRFQQNALIRFLLDFSKTKGFGMNELGLLTNISNEDWAQFYQLIGYTVSSFGGLSGIPKELVVEADQQADGLKEKE